MIVDSLDRVLGDYPISIATSLMLESLTNTGEFGNVKTAPELKKIPALYINVRTLIRNAINAFGNKEILRLSVKAVVDAVLEDWDSLDKEVHAFNPDCQVELYFCTYEGIEKRYPKAKFREYNTDRLAQFKLLEMDALFVLQKKKVITLEFKEELRGDKKTVIFTHCPLDLISESNFPDLALVESHTGAIKARHLWHTKLQIKKEITSIPFNLATLLIFGDNVMFGPQDLKARRVLIEISTKRKWNPNTTRSKMEQDIRLSHEPFLLEFFKRY